MTVPKSRKRRSQRDLAVGAGSQSEAAGDAQRPAPVHGHLYQPGPEVAGAGRGGRHACQSGSERVKVRSGASGQAPDRPELHEDPASLAPGDEAPGVAGAHPVLVADQHHVERLGHRGHDRAPLPWGGASTSTIRSRSTPSSAARSPTSGVPIPTTHDPAADGPATSPRASAVEPALHGHHRAPLEAAAASAGPAPV